jgi:hypothetical protein
VGGRFAESNFHQGSLTRDAFGVGVTEKVRSGGTGIVNYYSKHDWWEWIEDFGWRPGEAMKDTLLPCSPAC